MTAAILPVIGSSGFYELASPFDALAVDNVEYTCQGIRRISDYLANNEDVQADIYKANNLPEAAYDEDLASNAYIVSLQSRTGHWLYVPYRYILNYPSPNGIQYRSMMIGVSLPALPVSQNIDALTADVKQMVEGRLGVTVAVKRVDTSKITLIPLETHTQTQVERDMKKATESSVYATMLRLKSENEVLVQKVAALEAYIKTKP